MNSSITDFSEIKNLCRFILCRLIDNDFKHNLDVWHFFVAAFIRFLSIVLLKNFLDPLLNDYSCNRMNFFSDLMPLSKSKQTEV